MEKLISVCPECNTEIIQPSLLLSNGLIFSKGNVESFITLALETERKLNLALEVIRDLKRSLEEIEGNKNMTILGPSECEICESERDAHALGANKAFSQQAKIACEAHERNIENFKILGLE